MQQTEMNSPPSPGLTVWGRRVRIVVASYVLLIAVMLPINILYQGFLDLNLSSEGIETSAQFLGNEPCRVRTSYIPCTQLQWWADGEPYSRSIPTSNLSGLSDIRVRYSPWDPSHIELTHQRTPQSQGVDIVPRLLLAIALGLIFGISAWGVLRGR